MTEEVKSESVGEQTVVEELGELGRQLGTAFKAAWESEQRRELQQEISEGFKALGDQLEEAVKTAREGEALQELQTDVKQAVETARQSDALQGVRRGLLKGLRQINRELNDLVASWQARPATEVEGEEEVSKT